MVIDLDSQFEQRKKTILEIVKRVISQHHIKVSQTSINNLVIHLSLCISRRLNGSYIHTSESQINNLKDHEYYFAAEKMIAEIEQEFDVTIDKNQVSYTTMYLADINLLDIDFNCEFDLCDDDIETIISETIVMIKDKLSLDLRKNKEFYTRMSLHFYPALDRLQNDYQLIDNPLKSQIQLQHETEFKCAQIFNDIVSKYYHKSFNEHELAYIALHFGTAI